MLMGLGLVIAVALGQTAAPTQAATGRLAGRVTVEGTNAPLAGARVTLWPDVRPQPMQAMQPMFGPPPQALTDEDGRFAFRGLKPGSYRIDAQRTGYASMEEPGHAQTVQLTEGQSIDNFTLQLQKGAVISGRILGPTGEPQADVRVIALRRIQNAGGPARMIPAPLQGMQQTNDLGEFRLAGLPAGEYYVSAGTQMQSPFGGSGIAAPPPQGKARTTIATTYYPGTTDAAAAQPIAVARAADVGNISFTLIALPAFRVSGVVVDEEGKPIAGAMVMLMSDPRNGVFMGPQGNGRSGDDGRFTIDNVVAGSYRASASVPMVMGSSSGGFVSWSTSTSSSGATTTTSSSGTTSSSSGGTATPPNGSPAAASTGAVSGVVMRGPQMGPPTDVVVNDANVTGVRLVARRPQ